MLSLEKLRAVPQIEWEALAVRDVMQPVDESHFITVRASLEHAAYKLRANQLGLLAVLDGEGLLVGSLNENDLHAAA
jgi:hypothetical protein